MSDDAFDLIEQAVRSGGAESGFFLLAEKLKEQKNYGLLFEARRMQARHKLGLPLLWTGSIDDVTDHKRGAYEQALADAAREAGSLFLADGNIQSAWPYFRAIGEQEPVAAAIEKLDSAEEAVIQIALEDRVHPRKGFKLLLKHYGICRAITYFGQYPDPETREQCLILLVRSLHRELVENLKRAIIEKEGAVPETESASDLIAGRDWLFGDIDYYVDTSHVIAVIRFALDLTDASTLRLAIELCDYGNHLSPQFKYKVDPPFDDVYADHRMYLRALAGQDVDAAIAHFRKKVVVSDPDVAGTVPAQVMVALLVRLKRYQEAIQISLDYLSQTAGEQLLCPSITQLCQFAGDYELLRKLARERGDLLSFTAATLGA